VKLAIFYHISQIGLGAFYYQQQVHILYTSGLISQASHIHFGVNGDRELFNVPESVVIVRNQNWKEETETLMSLRDFCKNNPDHKVLYFHMKGVTKESMNGESWRLMMEYFVIDKWKECVEYLNEYDAVGSNLKIFNQFLESNFRLDREFWIGSGNGKMKSLYQPEDHEPYTYFYQEKDYVS